MPVRASIMAGLSTAGIVLGKQQLYAQGSESSGLNLKATSHVGIGYVANIPATFLGVSSFFVSPRVLGGMGLYADFKRTTSSPGNSPYYLPNVSVMDAEVTYGDQLYIEKSDWTTINAGLLYAVTKEFAL